MAKTGTGNKGMWVCENMAYQINDHNCSFFSNIMVFDMFLICFGDVFLGFLGLIPGVPKRETNPDLPGAILCRFQFLAVVCLIARQPRTGHSGPWVSWSFLG